MSFSIFATPQPQQQQQQQQQQLSLFPTQSSPFQPGMATPMWPQQQQQQFQPPQQQQTPQPPQQAQQQLYLFTNDKTPASYSTEWKDLHPDSQKFLLQIEERILEYRDESQRLDQCSRLYDSSVSSEGFELDASHLVQELGGISTSMDRQKTLHNELMSSVKDMLRNAEVAVRSFTMLRPRFVHPSSGGASSATAPSHAPGATTVPGSNTQSVSASVVPVFDFYSGLPKKPSPFLQHTVERFEKYLGECRQWVEELEQLLLLDYSDRNGTGYGTSLVDSLPKVMSNVHDFFVHVAAKVESIHQYIESMKTAYLADQRRRGDGSDPFLEADRRETARQEAAAKRVHPTLHLPPPPPSSTQAASLYASSAGPSGSNVPQASQGASSSGAGFSLFGSSSPAPAMSSASLFATPSASAPTSSLFGATAASPQTPLFSSSSASLFGSATTPSLFGSATPSFSSAPAFGGPLFSTPFASGAAMGSGASFGGATKTSRGKSRSQRR